MCVWGCVTALGAGEHGVKWIQIKQMLLWSPQLTRPTAYSKYLSV